MPDRIETATSGRARCRACKRPIGKGEERFAEAAPNPVAEGETQHYYHLACASERRPGSFAKLVASLSPRSDLEALAASAALAITHRRLERLGVLERAKSARANCRHCRELIEKGVWRVAIQPIEEGRMAAWGFVHLRCVANYTGVKPEPERLLRYSALSDEERAEVEALLAALPIPEPVPEGSEDEPRSMPTSTIPASLAENDADDDD
jgi:hypothetical protein